MTGERSSTPTPAIICENLSKWYGQVLALHDITLRIEKGIVGLLGPNGAGKTTLLELAIGRLRPSRGTIRVMGEDPWKTPAIFSAVGYCPDSDGLYERMSGLDFVTLMAQLSGFSRAESRKRAMERLELVGMTQHCHRPAGSYSKGMKQRVKLAAALVHDPRLLILDEPLNGLDPIARLEISKLLRELSERGVSILLSSHILAEVESLTSHIVLIHRGKILAEGKISEIRALIDNQPYTYRIESPAPRRLAAILVHLPAVESILLNSDARSILVRTTDAVELCRVVQEVVSTGDIAVTSIGPTDESLEAVFQYLVKD